jgi:DNA-binding response OmpR family regulator
VRDGKEARRSWLNGHYQLVVLDLMLPGESGLDLARWLRTQSDIPIVMLTAMGEETDRIIGLELGADDYVPKPFAFAELVARLRALARRSHPAVPPVLSVKGITLDPARRVATRSGSHLELGAKELAVLELLMAAGGRVVSAEELLERAWDEMADPFTTAVKVTVSRLRRKLGDPPVIETVERAGYRI